MSPAPEARTPKENSKVERMKRTVPILLAAFLAAPLAAAQGPAPDKPRPIPIRDSVFIEDLTWMEVRDLIAGGKHTAIVASGGVEQNGPYLVTGKHNVLLRGLTEVIARDLGNALVAPILKLVPEGDFDPPTGHMRYPGTVGLSQETFRAVVRDVARSLKASGFSHIILVGDSGGNQRGMQEVAEELTAEWRGSPGVHFIPEFYDYQALQTWLSDEGVEQTPEGIHDDYAITSMMAAVDPNSIRISERRAAGLTTINGVDVEPLDQTRAWGNKLFRHRSEVTVAAIRAAIASHATN